mmetsp:Transcript_30532/g.22642  ORF Transcript_30532/g.22642 Transcript_30532/m.22642 type:complete len:242 (-) Transcript_30532:225-950(-)
MIESLCTASKHLNSSGMGILAGEQAMEKARESLEKVDRIARTTSNKSSFMNLGEKSGKLVSDDSLPKQSKAGYLRSHQQLDETYVSDDTVPGDIFPLVQRYREALISVTGGSQALLIDDFFAEAHSIMKDAHMREIARIRNEHAVEVTRLRKTLGQKLEGGRASLRSVENFRARKESEQFHGDSEVERQRRALVQENEVLKKRLRAVETIAKSGNLEKQKFMEGATWIAKKAHLQVEQHIS